MASLRRSASPPPAPNIPQVKIDGVEATPDAAVSVELPDAAHEYEKEVVAADEATVRLRKQLADIQKSEEYQREQAALQHQRTQQLNSLAEFAASEADKHGHQRGTETHLNAARGIFHQHLAHLQAQAQPAPAPAPQPTPEFFAPPPPPAPPDGSSLYSAPVSREVPAGGYRESIPTRTTLTPDEIAIAKASGISPTEYARNKLKMLRQQRAGEIQK